MKNVFLFVAIILFAMQLSACSKNSEDLSLECVGTSKVSESLAGSSKNTEDKTDFNLFFKDKKRFSPERQKFISEECQIWTDDLIKCVSSSEKSKIDVTVNRITGEASVYQSWSQDSDYANTSIEGKCKRIEKRKI